MQSMAMKIWSAPTPVTTSRTLMMFSCSSASKMLISRSEVIGKPSWPLSTLICLSATISPLPLSRAFQTTPYVPSSIFCTRS